MTMDDFIVKYYWLIFLLVGILMFWSGYWMRGFFETFFPSKENKIEGDVLKGVRKKIKNLLEELDTYKKIEEELIKIRKKRRIEEHLLE